MFRLRFAPSPTGHLHVGNARTALFNWLMARRAGGTLILRIEDTDAGRSTLESERAIVDDLRWLGLDWDEGIDKGGVHGPYRQSERLSIYTAHAARLVETGHAYRCFCSAQTLEADRRAALAEGRPPKYAGRCRALDAAGVAQRLAAGERPVIRLRVPVGREVRFDDLVRGLVSVHTDVIGDAVLVRSDGTPAYNFAVVVDDGLMRVTHVVRGEDHISNTPRQILLYEGFGWTPPRFGHLSLVMGPDHTPLSKRHGATSVAEFRQRGYLPEALANYLALIGWGPASSAHEGPHAAPGDAGSRVAPHSGASAPSEEILPLEELARRFRIEDVSHSAGVFDVDKLAWVNRHYLKAAAPDRLVDLSRPYLEAAGWIRGPVGPAAHAWLSRALPSAAASVDRLEQVPDRLRLVFAWDTASVLADTTLAAELHERRPVLEVLAAELTASPRLTDRERFRAMAARIKDRTGAKGRALFHPIRVALTGAASGPELDVLVPAIDTAADLPADDGLAPVMGCRERALAIVGALGPRSEA
jgi:nondiscriminating glutamyl-tRNA synthetase